MKFFYTLAAATLCAVSNAEERSSGSLVQKAKEAAAAESNANGNLALERAIMDMMGEAGEEFNGYGCWCYFDELHGKGKSHPVDQMDAFCKTLAEGYDCIQMDEEEEGSIGEDGPCTPWEVFYLPASIGDTVVEQCNDRNGENTCAARACIVEMQFVTNVFRFVISGGAMDSNNKHDNGFSVEENCPTKQGVQSEKSCCGAYPYRHPFKTYDGTRSCCGSKTYDNTTLKCCGDGKIRASC